MMIEIIECLVNAWYKEWLKTHDPVMEDFEQELQQIIPKAWKFTLDTTRQQWMILE